MTYLPTTFRSIPWESPTAVIGPVPVSSKTMSSMLLILEGVRASIILLLISIVTSSAFAALELVESISTSATNTVEPTLIYMKEEEKS